MSEQYKAVWGHTPVWPIFLGDYMALTSASTIEDAENQYLDNLVWEGDITKAQDCLEAIRFLLVKRPVGSAAASGRAHTYDKDTLNQEKQRLEAFISRSGATSSIRVGDFSGT